MSRPVLIAVAPNGARHTQSDHPAVPIGPEELAATARDCLGAGAAMIHVHVRNERGVHSLEPDRYRPAIDAIRGAVGDAMLIQVTSEAAGIYTPSEQMRLIAALQPDGVSVAVRELFAAETAAEEAAKFLASLDRRGTLLQYILYSPDDVRHYRQLVDAGAIPSTGHMVLFVLGRYPDVQAAPGRLHEYVAALGDVVPWMACAFGRQTFDVLIEAAALGGHVRIGFENGWQMPDGSIAPDNAALVRALAQRIEASGRRIAQSPMGSDHRLDCNSRAWPLRTTFFDS